MPNHASLTIMGHATGQAVARQTANGTAVANVTVAVNTGYGQNKTTLWQDVAVFGKAAEFVREIEKGDLVFAAGRVEVDEWQDKQTGTKRSKLILIASDCYRCRAKLDRAHAAEPAAQPQAPPPETDDPETDDIPF